MLTLLDDIDRQHQALPEPSDYDLPGADSALVTDLTREIAELHQALDRDIDLAERDLDTSMDILSDAKEFRRLARTHASDEARAVVQTGFLDELMYEIHEIPFVVMNVVRQGIALVRNLDSVLLDLGALAAFFWGLIGSVVLLLLWGLTRERTDGWLRQALTALRSVRPGDLGLSARINDWVGARGVAGNWLNLEPVLLPALLLGIDFIAGAIVYRALPEDWIYISFAVFIWLLPAGHGCREQRHTGLAHHPRRRPPGRPKGLRSRAGPEPSAPSELLSCGRPSQPCCLVPHSKSSKPTASST